MTKSNSKYAQVAEQYAPLQYPSQVFRYGSSSVASSYKSPSSIIQQQQAFCPPVQNEQLALDQVSYEYQQLIGADGRFNVNEPYFNPNQFTGPANQELYAQQAQFKNMYQNLPTNEAEAQLIQLQLMNLILSHLQIINNLPQVNFNNMPIEPCFVCPSPNINMPNYTPNNQVHAQLMDNIPLDYLMINQQYNQQPAPIVGNSNMNLIDYNNPPNINYANPNLDQFNNFPTNPCRKINNLNPANMGHNQPRLVF